MPRTHNKQQKLSSRLSHLLELRKSIRLDELNHLFAEKSFAVAFILLMITAALPLPTGGITHIFELVAIVLAIEMILNRQEIWLPKSLLKHKIKPHKAQKTFKSLIRITRFFERFSRPRGHFISDHHLFVRFMGLVILIYTIFAFIAPPFSGLDTLPALGVVLIALGLMLDDLIVTFIGILIGIAGVVLILSLSDLVIKLFQRFFT